MFNMNMGNMFNGMFKPVPAGNCKIGMNGLIAVKTRNGYKTFDTKTNHLTNCDSFAFDVDIDNAFFVLPTVSVEKGDIILVDNKPHAVIEVGDNSIKAFSYNDSTISEIVPEYHVFMGQTYCYGKIFCPFVGMMKEEGGFQNIMNMMMMSQMFGDGKTNDMGSMFMMMNMMGNGTNLFANMFNGAFNFGKAEKKDEVTE